MKALVIDDEHTIRLALRHFLLGKGCEVLLAPTGGEGLAIARAALPDIVFLDQRLPDMEGDSLLQSLTSPEIGARVVMMTAYAEIDKAVQAMKNGADYFFPKPLDLEQVAVILDKLSEKLKLAEEIDHYRRLNNLRNEMDSIIGESPQMIKIQKLISLLARNRETPVLILGESGAGKQLVAKLIHILSGVKGKLVEINCASLSDNLLESELFGHEKGAFTDAKESKIGLFELADSGSVFLDEVAEMPLSAQARLLKVLDTKIFRRVGGVTDKKSSARIMAATNKNLTEMVKQGTFREDLYYRINVMPITVPPLRERGKDIILMADFFAGQIGERMGKGQVGVSAEAMRHLQNYHWPGNVRELKNVIERALILSGGKIFPEHLPAEIRQVPALLTNTGEAAQFPLLSKVVDDYIVQVIQAVGGNHSRAAAILGISRSTLLARLNKKREAV